MNAKSNSPLPYNYKREDDLNYKFTTESGVIYTAYFVSCDTYSKDLTAAYMFNFEPEAGPQSKYDPRIKATVKSIILKFFELNGNSLIFVCDSMDGLEQARKRLFDNWFKTAGLAGFIKEDLHKVSNFYHYYSSIIMREDHPEKEMVIRAFYALGDIMA